jgi:hypothetical protein
MSAPSADRAQIDPMPTPPFSITLPDEACLVALWPSHGGPPLRPETRRAVEKASRHWAWTSFRTVRCSPAEARDLFDCFRYAAVALAASDDPRVPICVRAVEQVRRALWRLGVSLN